MIGRAMIVRGAGFVLLFATSATRVEAQNCQVIKQQLLSGGSDVAWALRAQDYYNRNCLGRQDQQTPPPGPSNPTSNPQPTYQTPTRNTLPNPLLQEFSKLGEFIKKGQPLRQNIPLSSGVKMMETVAAPPPAPTDYVDPFAARTFPAITKSASGPVRPGSIWDRSQWVTLSPPAAPSAPPTQQPSPSSGPCGPYAAQTGVCSAPVTGFDWKAPY
jgi:hypothetical protein